MANWIYRCAESACPVYPLSQLMKIRLSEMINTVIFEMDGTVLDTLDDLTDSMNYVLKRFKMPCHGKEDYRCFFGNGVRKVSDVA